MSDERQGAERPIWNLRELVGDLADQIPQPPPGRTRPEAPAPASAAAGAAIRATSAEAPARTAPAERDEPSDRDEPLDPAAFGGLPVVPVDPATAPEPVPWRPLEPPTGNPQRPAGAALRKAAGLVLVVLLLLVGTAYGAYRMDPGAADGSTYDGPGSSPDPYSAPVAPGGGPFPSAEGSLDTGIPTTTPAPEDPEAAALTELSRLHEQDLPTISLDGRYVAQLASKSVGIVDPEQWAANGSHTFYATDILAEHQQLRTELGGEARVILLLSTDYGRQQLYEGKPLWLTFAVVPAESKDGVDAWCRAQFPQLDGAELPNRCVPRRLRPPGT
ncbi:hypothetical protein ACFYUR_01025 [Micromonospora haikouensis]|uniref:hypothetical protein n=1 Tax=Micromonospora haikouensis TaxID=686309 RepID=UPI0036C73976